MTGFADNRQNPCGPAPTASAPDDGSGWRKALEIQNRLDETVGGRIAVEHRNDIGAERSPNIGVSSKRFRIGLADKFRRHVRMVQPLGYTMHHRCFKVSMMQDGFVDET